VTSKTRPIDIRLISTSDLLGREQVKARPDLLGVNILNKAVMVTGAGGSIGSELCRQILLQKPKCLLLYDISEFGLYLIERDLLELCTAEQIHAPIIPILGNILDRRKLREIISKFGIHTLYHAAAYKHVPLLELNISEGLRNNVCGTFTTAEAACDLGVDNFILISTDKAVRPTSYMGASKRISEMVCQAFAASGCKTIFSMVRFGNVLGSSGSVSQVFEKQILSGGPVTVTHRDVIRYFMTITEATQLVIQAGAMGKGGDVFVLDMGKPVKILDLAERMIKIAGFKPVYGDQNETGDEEILIRFNGLRPGEKLFEELLIKEGSQETAHHGIMKANDNYIALKEMRDIVDAIDNASLKGDDNRISEIIKGLPIGFQPGKTQL
jgi:FlaA1/EpsC-like NDP-sugar epimerase